MRKFIWPIVIVLLAIGLYFYIAHWYIYYKIGQGNLIAPDIERTYFMGHENQTAKNLIYVALGDSLTSGVGVDDYQESFPALIAQKIISADKSQITLKDFSYPGYKTNDLINNLLPQAIAVQPDIVTLLIGVNDIHNQVSAGDFENNYRTILNRLTKETKAKIYLVSLPFIGSESLLYPPYNVYFDHETVRFNEIIKQLAGDYQLKYIDIYTPTVSTFKKDGAHYSRDLFHPSAEGYRLWAQIIYDHLDR